MFRLFTVPNFFRKTVMIERHTGSSGHFGFICKKNVPRGRASGFIKVEGERGGRREK